MKSYFSTFRMRWKMETQYRGAALGGLLCQLFFGLILVALYRALYAGKPQSTPLSAVTTYVWLQQAFFRMIATSDGGMLESIMNTCTQIFNLYTGSIVLTGVLATWLLRKVYKLFQNL